MLKTRTWVVFILSLLVVSIAISCILLFHRKSGTTAQLSQDGVVIREIDLSAVKEPYSFDITDADGNGNTVTVENGRICISDADCPDRICVEHGWISTSGDPIVCLPHKLVIRIISELDDEPDTTVH